MGARLKKERKITRKMKKKQGCKSARTPKILRDALNKITIEELLNGTRS